MVKKWIVILSIMVFLVVGCIIEYNYINNAFDYLHENLEDYQLLLDKNREFINTEYNVKYIEDLHEAWHKKSKVLKGLIWHTGIKDVEVGLSRIKTYTQENDYTEAKAELQSLIDYVVHYKSDFSFSIENIVSINKDNVVFV